MKRRKDMKSAWCGTVLSTTACRNVSRQEGCRQAPEVSTQRDGPEHAARASVGPGTCLRCVLGSGAACSDPRSLQLHELLVILRYLAFLRIAFMQQYAVAQLEMLALRQLD